MSPLTPREALRSGMPDLLLQLPHPMPQNCLCPPILLSPPRNDAELLVPSVDVVDTLPSRTPATFILEYAHLIPCCPFYVLVDNRMDFVHWTHHCHSAAPSPHFCHHRPKTTPNYAVPIQRRFRCLTKPSAPEPQVSPCKYLTPRRKTASIHPLCCHYPEILPNYSFPIWR
jgi:hypothetical protein